MNIIDLRKSLRRSTLSQRVSDRRKVTYVFGSPEWLEYFKKNNLESPKFNRRKAERRNDKRRIPDRRQQSNNESVRTERKFSRIFLTRAERKLIEDLYLNDLE